MQSSRVKLNTPVTFGCDDGLAFRLYPDTRPRNLEIAPLQKGFVLMCRGEELIEEGAGFGAPIAKYADHTLFSSTAQVHVEQQTESSAVYRKVFVLDTVSKKQVRSARINDNLYSVLHATFERAYLNRQGLRPVFDWTMRLRKTVGVTTQFTKVKPRGEVAVTYHCQPNHIKVTVDLSALEKQQCEEILILNEQGASTFRQYSDSNGIVLSDRQVGAWTQVTAKQATFSNMRREVSFELENRETAQLYRGREQIKDRFSWAGMTYSLNPRTSSFQYVIRTQLI